MAINLLNLQPHKVSRDLSGYITYVYGIPRVAGGAGGGGGRGDGRAWEEKKN